MGKKVFFLNKAGVRKMLLKSPEIQKIISQATFKTAQIATGMSGGKTYKGKVTKGSQRCWGVIYPEGTKASLNNLRHNTLIKALRSTKV